MSIQFRSVSYTSRWIGDRSLLPLDIASNPFCTSGGSGNAHFLLICLVHSARLMRSFHFIDVPVGPPLFQLNRVSDADLRESRHTPPAIPGDFFLSEWNLETGSAGRSRAHFRRVYAKA